MGVTFFSDDAPLAFGAFDRAFITMFCITAGDTWVEEIPRISLDDSSLNYPFALFVVTYIVVANWTVLQVTNTALFKRVRGRLEARKDEGGYPPILNHRKCGSI
jgi:hypothetical protein